MTQLPDHNPETMQTWAALPSEEVDTFISSFPAETNERSGITIDRAPDDTDALKLVAAQIYAVSRATYALRHGLSHGPEDRAANAQRAYEILNGGGAVMRISAPNEAAWLKVTHAKEPAAKRSDDK